MCINFRHEEQRRYPGSDECGLREGRVERQPRPFKHPQRAGRVTVPHPEAHLPIGTLKSIERQSGVKLS
ncbi:MAG TPA: type II toxin-antitoxin system HicA family toxin [Sphingomicrobium sp.]